MRALVLNARARKEYGAVNCFANEMIDILSDRGATINKRLELDKALKSINIKSHTA